MKNIKIKKNEENPESAELLAQSVIQVAEGFEKVSKLVHAFRWGLP